MRYLSVALLFVASTAAGQSWQQIVSLDPNGGVLYVDASDIADVKGYRRAWFKWSYATDRAVPSEYRESVPKATTYRWVQSANLFHCAEQTTALAEQRWFDSHDIDLGSRRAEALRFVKVSSGSVDELMLDAVCGWDAVRERERREEMPQMTHGVAPELYYPKGSIRRGEQGSATVKTCVDSKGKLLREPVVTVSSGFPELDRAAIRVAKGARYSPGVRDGVALPESCLDVPVQFRQQRHPPRSADVGVTVERAPNLAHYLTREARARGEKGSPVVEACVGGNGKLLRDPVIAESSGFPDLDAAAIEVAKASKYRAASSGGERLPESCIKFRVSFAREPTL